MGESLHLAWSRSLSALWFRTSRLRVGSTFFLILRKRSLAFTGKGMAESNVESYLYNTTSSSIWINLPRTGSLLERKHLLNLALDRISSQGLGVSTRIYDFRGRKISASESLPPKALFEAEKCTDNKSWFHFTPSKRTRIRGASVKTASVNQKNTFCTGHFTASKRFPKNRKGKNRIGESWGCCRRNATVGNGIIYLREMV